MENLKKFLIDDKGFSENRVESGLKRIEGSFEKANQVRLDNFFKLKPTVVSTNTVNEKYNKVSFIFKIETANIYCEKEKIRKIIIV